MKTSALTTRPVAVRRNVVLHPDHLFALDRIAAEKLRTRSSLVRDAIEQFIKREVRK